MKTLKYYFPIFLLAPLAILMACHDDEPTPTLPVDPSDPDALAKVLVIPGSKSRSGEPPQTSIDMEAPAVGNNQSSALVTSGNTIYLPFTFFTSEASEGYAGSYVQIDGASSYWDIPNTSDNNTSSGQVIIPLTIPDNVLRGEFGLSYSIYDAQNRVSNVLYTTIEVDSLKSCPAYESGNDGLTIFTYDLGDESGTVSVSYEMYSAPDRIDIFYDGKWIEGSGSSIEKGDFPPTNYTCERTVDGYISGGGSLEFSYNPSKSRQVTIYMSGCLSGTAWDLGVSCPY